LPTDVGDIHLLLICSSLFPTVQFAQIVSAFPSQTGAPGPQRFMVFVRIRAANCAQLVTSPLPEFWHCAAFLDKPFKQTSAHAAVLMLTRRGLSLAGPTNVNRPDGSRFVSPCGTTGSTPGTAVIRWPNRRSMDISCHCVSRSDSHCRARRIIERPHESAPHRLSHHHDTASSMCLVMRRQVGSVKTDGRLEQATEEPVETSDRSNDWWPQSDLEAMLFQRSHRAGPGRVMEATDRCHWAAGGGRGGALEREGGLG
jgi:hypothetical protein